MLPMVKQQRRLNSTKTGPLGTIFGVVSMVRIRGGFSHPPLPPEAADVTTCVPPATAEPVGASPVAPTLLHYYSMLLLCYLFLLHSTDSAVSSNVLS